MDRYKKELAQRVRRTPIYSFPVSYRLKESDRLEITDKDICIKEVAVQMGNKQTGTVYKVSRDLLEGPVGTYIIYYDDPEEPAEERKKRAMLDVSKGRWLTKLRTIEGIGKNILGNTERRAMNPYLRKGIEYDLIVGEEERVYKPKYNYLGLPDEEVL